MADGSSAARTASLPRGLVRERGHGPRRRPYTFTWEVDERDPCLAHPAPEGIAGTGRSTESRSPPRRKQPASQSVSSLQIRPRVGPASQPKATRNKAGLHAI